MSDNRIGIFSQLVPPQPSWTVENVPDQTGKVVIVTGANRGIGKETARVLLSKGAKVYIACRDEEKARVAIEELKQATGKDTICSLKCDLADLTSVRTAAEEFIGKESELHTLYNNAGVMYTPVDQVTTQGYDLQFGTNVLGHFYLTKLLLPVLTATATKAPAKSVRVVNVSSLAHYFGAPEGVRWTSLAVGHESLDARKGLGSARLFGQSKTGTIFFSNELARRYAEEGIVSIALHPGTDISRHAGTLVHRIGRFFKYALFYVVSCGDMSFLKEETRAVSGFAQDASASAAGNLPAGATPSLPKVDTVGHSAITSLYAGTAGPAGELNGKYLTAWARVTLPHSKAVNADEEKKLWDWCEEQVKVIGENAEKAAA